MGIGTRKPFDVAQGVAPMLVAGGGPAVVANQFKVLDPSAVAFSQHFYWALASGRTLGDAAREARVAVNYAIAGEAIDWAIPVLFARNPGDQLVAPRDAGGVLEHGDATGLGGRQRRSRDRLRELVAIWDVNYAIPPLDAIVARLNAAQPFFQFEAVEITAPLGTWRRVPDAQEQRAYLDADEVEGKLKGALARLGATHLCCVTNLPLADKKEYDLLAHVAADGRISVVSTDDMLARLAPPEISVERLIANFLVFSLGDIAGHTSGPKNCPFYYNDERDVIWVAGPVTICPRCVATLRRKGVKGERLKALMALAHAYGAPAERRR
jgi:hypothetical protein